MAQRKGSSSESVEAKAKYNPGKQQIEQLKREIQNYNRRLQRAIKITPSELRDVLPPKLSYSEEVKKIKSAKGFKRRIKTLKSFTAEGLEITAVDGRLITKAQLELTKAAVAEENRQRRQRLARQRAKQEQLGRFPTSQTYGTRQLELEKVLKSAQADQLTAAYLEPEEGNPLTEAYRQNYIRHVYEALTLWEMSYGVDDEIRNTAMELIGLVAELPKEVIDASIGIPETSITMISDREVFLSNIEYILMIWKALL